MSKITFDQFNILTKEQLINIIEKIKTQSYTKMKNNNELIKVFNKKYNLENDLINLSKDDLIKILLNFYPKAC